MEAILDEKITEKNEIEKENSLNNEIENQETENLGEKQKNFLETSIGKVINTGCDIALRAILPNAIEDEIIGIKNVIFTEGIQNGIKTAIDSAINIGKSITGIFTGKFDTISQAYTAVKSGGIIDSASNIIDTAVKSAKENGLINKTTANVIKKGKNIVKDCLTNSIEENFMEQVDGIEKVGKYINNWNTYLEQKDLEGMNREYKKITKKLETLLPLESTIKEARVIENVQTLIKNKGNSLNNITEEELKLAQII